MAFGDPTGIIWNIPDDAQVVHQLDGWEIYHSRSSNAVCLYATEYHTASLMLSSGDLERLLEKLKPGSDSSRESGTGKDEPGNGLVNWLSP